ncbi:MAG TPA: hypothetical protein VK184_03550 [Nostocaceae cyanobacterium]|nr:hypothetical protein [Nostocaceae cyanobacterium]
MIEEIKVEALTLEPKVFQYKIVCNKKGSTGSLSGVGKWNEYLAGIILVWRDKLNNKIFVVNGHNRVLKAIELGVEKLLCRYIEVQTAKEARWIGALTNMAENNGTAIDAGKFLRDSGYGVQRLKEFGINSNLKMIKDGFAISNLADFLFDRVVQGQLDLEHGVILGGLGSREQLEIWTSIKDKKVSSEALNEIIKNIQDAQTGQMSLFNLMTEGNREQELQRLELIAQIRKRLVKSQKLLKLVSNEANVQKLEAIGNALNKQGNKAAKKSTETILGVFDQLKNQAGAVADILAQGMEQLKAASLENVAEDCVLNLTIAIPEMLNSVENKKVGK